MTDPKTLQIVDRTVTILKDIREGSTYWKTPADVVKGQRALEEATGFPLDMVHLGPEWQDPARALGTNQVFPSVIVTSYLAPENGDYVTGLIRHLADIRLAIDEDFKSGAAGSLGALATHMRFMAAVTDALGELLPYGGFHQEIQFIATGAWGAL